MLYFDGSEFVGEFCHGVLRLVSFLLQLEFVLVFHFDVEFQSLHILKDGVAVIHILFHIPVAVFDAFVFLFDLFDGFEGIIDFVL
jgi:hypothetical protein